MSKTNSFDLFTRYLSQRDSIVQELHEANQIRSKPMDVQARWVNSVTSKLIAFNGLREELEIQNQPFPGVNEDTPEFSIYLQVKQSYLQLKELLEQASTTHKIKKPNTPNDISVHKETSGAVRRRQRKRVIALNKVTIIDEESVMMCKTCQERGVDPSRCIPRGRQRCSECYEKHTTCNWAAGGWPGLGRKPGPSGTPQNGGRPGKLRKAGHVGASIKASATTREAGSAPQAKATPKSAFVSHKLGTSTSTSAHGNVNGHSTSGPSRNPLDKDPSITEAARSSKIYVPATTSHAAQKKQLSNATISPTTNLATGNSGIQQSSVSFKPYRKRYSETSSHRVMEKRQNMPWFSSLLNTGDTPRRSESSVTIDGII